MIILSCILRQQSLQSIGYRISLGRGLTHEHKLHLKPPQSPALKSILHRLQMNKGPKILLKIKNITCGSNSHFYFVPLCDYYGLNCALTPHNTYVEVLISSTSKCDYLEIGSFKGQLRLNEVTSVGPNSI